MKINGHIIFFVRTSFSNLSESCPVSHRLSVSLSPVHRAQTAACTHHAGTGRVRRPLARMLHTKCSESSACGAQTPRARSLPHLQPPCRPGVWQSGNAKSSGLQSRASISPALAKQLQGTPQKKSKCRPRARPAAPSQPASPCTRANGLATPSTGARLAPATRGRRAPVPNRRTPTAIAPDRHRPRRRRRRRRLGARVGWSRAGRSHRAQP